MEIDASKKIKEIMDDVDESVMDFLSENKISKQQVLSEWFKAYLSNDLERYCKLEFMLTRIENKKS